LEILAEEEMLEKLIIEFIQKKQRSLNDLVSILKCDKNEIKQILEELVEQNKISRFKEKFYFNKKK
jgi:predicted HTH domain antitoxin